MNLEKGKKVIYIKRLKMLFNSLYYNEFCYYPFGEIGKNIEKDIYEVRPLNRDDFFQKVLSKSGRVSLVNQSWYSNDKEITDNYNEVLNIVEKEYNSVKTAQEKLLQDKIIRLEKQLNNAKAELKNNKELSFFKKQYSDFISKLSDFLEF